MANQTLFKETKIGVGDNIRVYQRLKEKDKERVAQFDGLLIAIKGEKDAKMITVRKIGEQQIGIERLFPLNSPTIEKIEVIKPGLSGARRAKLYFVRKQSKKQIAKIYSRLNSKKG